MKASVLLIKDLEDGQTYFDLDLNIGEQIEMEIIESFGVLPESGGESYHDET